MRACPSDDMEALTLHELNNLVRCTLEGTLPDDYWLQAELSEVREGYNGHCYLEFVEKDRSGRNLVAKARGQIWRNVYLLLKPGFERETGQRLAPGLKVLVRVNVTFHELYGYSLNVTDIDPTYTLGDMARRRKEILDRLASEGILNDNKELPFPRMANRVAVISSASAAGYGDFCDQLLHNEYGLRFNVRLFPAVMQGDRVEESVLSALDAVMAECDRWDVVVIIRGGGATSDLSGFDTYLLAAACAQFPLPVITGIGHERDDTVLDAVAHTRVKTPTAAAALLVNHQWDEAAALEDLSHRAVQAATGRMERERLRMDRLSMRIGGGWPQLKGEALRRLDRAAQRMQQAARQRLTDGRYRMELCSGRVERAALAVLERERHRLELWSQRAGAADPALLLKRGYSMTFCNGELVRTAAALKSGDEITTRLAEGELRSVVK